MAEAKGAVVMAEAMEVEMVEVGMVVVVLEAAKAGVRVVARVEVATEAEMEVP